MTGQPSSGWGARIDHLEESVIAIILGLMTVITFINVVARYVFNDNLLWALEVTVFLFAWLVLLGVSYCVKKNLHLGVDVVVNLLPPHLKRIAAILAVTACLAFSLLLLKGSWDYWYPFATKRAWLETDDVPMPELLQFLKDAMNEGERWEKLPRFIPYFALPLGVALLTFRFLQAAWLVLKGDLDLIIASHEMEEAEELSTPSAGKEG